MYISYRERERFIFIHYYYIIDNILYMIKYIVHLYIAKFHQFNFMESKTIRSCKTIQVKPIQVYSKYILKNDDELENGEKTY